MAKKALLERVSAQLGLIVMTLSALSGGPARAAAPDAPRDDDEYNFSWLDPDKKIYVLQNRRYLKSDRPIISVLGGSGLSNPYRNTLNIEPRFGFYFNESVGIEVFATFSSNAENNTVNALLDASGNTSAIPFVREIRSQYGGLIHWAPWYAKINVFNQILYFDWYFEAGGGVMTSAQDRRANKLAAPNFVTETLPAFFIGTGQQFFLNQTFVFRIDVMNGIYSASYKNNSTEKALFSNWNVGMGLGMRL